MSNRKRERNDRNRNRNAVERDMLRQEANFLHRLEDLVATAERAPKGYGDGCECAMCEPPHTVAPAWWW